MCLGALRAVAWAGIAGQALAQQLWCQAWGSAGRAALAGPSASAGTAATALDSAICRLCLPDARLPVPPVDLLMRGEIMELWREGGGGLPVGMGTFSPGDGGGGGRQVDSRACCNPLGVETGSLPWRSDLFPGGLIYFLHGRHCPAGLSVSAGSASSSDCKEKPQVRDN